MFTLVVCGPVFVLLIGVHIWLSTKWGKRWLDSLG